MKFIVSTLMAIIVTLFPTPHVDAEVPPCWTKISGVDAGGHEGQTDGILNDRENSYAWSQEIFDGYLYVGTNRNILGTMLGFVEDFLDPNLFVGGHVPDPTDQRGRIYRMNLNTENWELFYLGPEDPQAAGGLIMGQDMGYRSMKTFKADGKDPVMYVGTAGSVIPIDGGFKPGQCALLAIEADGTITRIFAQPTPSFDSIRGLAEHNGTLFWATSETLLLQPDQPGIWYSRDPLEDFDGVLTENSEYGHIDVPDNWFPDGAEITDMISYNDFLYVFFVNYRTRNGFWCAKVKNQGNEDNPDWVWDIIVGEDDTNPEPDDTAKYPPGMDRFRDNGANANGGATPVLFDNKVYVGTASDFILRLTRGHEPDDILGTLGGGQLFRFDENDDWERVMPPDSVGNGIVAELMSGWFNPANLYIWRFGSCGDRLYAGTFDIGSLFALGEDRIQTGIPELDLLLQIINRRHKSLRGFDLYFTDDGDNWFPLRLNGFDDHWNYGSRSFATYNGTLFLGTANPFYGCQIWKHPCECTDQPMQFDKDLVPKEIEDKAPNQGDGNKDGIKDSIQPHVASFPSYNGTDYITVVCDSECEQIISPYSFFETPDDPDYEFPYGIVGFILPCTQGEITIYFHGVHTLNNFVFRKYGPTTPGDLQTIQWYTLPNVVFGKDEVGAYARFTLINGQLGDITGVESIPIPPIIIDPGGPARKISTIPAINTWGLLLLSGLLFIFCLFFLKRKKAWQG
ncbi:MAG: hypothetical protein DRH24_13485 [Deltaproteobacteria bacterium]|nr:MAG: hypothetical protein DRH24_13485 [Deltaproteobacteria bacterium]